MRPIIIGAGPAGLTAAYEFLRHGVKPLVLEGDTVVGGISRTANYKGYLFDIGGHRFFTKVAQVEQFWHEILGDDLLKRPRLSRILYGGKFYDYPLNLSNVLNNLGLVESAHCGLSYAKAHLFPRKPELDFETWVTNRFGWRLYTMFFRSYTEKVWGIPCTEIQAEWAAQRIKGLSLITAVKNALMSKQPANKKDVIKTLIHEFEYPRRGPGMMWEKVADLVQQGGGEILMSHPVTRIRWESGRVTGVEAGGSLFPGDHIISTMPIRDLIVALDPAPGLDAAALDFNYRDFLTVALILRKRDTFPDNWIYIHDSRVKVGRIQNFKNWSPEMVPDPETSCLGLEYFCFEGDGLWTMPDRDLIELGRRELDAIGLADAADVIDGTVVRMPKAYPVYDGTYKRGLSKVREFLPSVPNLHLVGRNGMHHYNNQDHSMLTAMLAVRNVLGADYNLWDVNVDEEYHEEGARIDINALKETQPLVPSRRSG
jgi:protoporphyrinogen oxidase